MRALFYISDREWSARARVFVAAARGLVARGHQATIVCYSGTPILEHIAGNGVETALVDADANVAASGWELRKVLQERFVEVAFVHTEREQLVVSSAMRFAERGAVVRRLPIFGTVPVDTDRLARRLATAGLLFSTAAEADAAAAARWEIHGVAPIGVDPSLYDAVQPISRAALGIPAGGVLLACPYTASGRPQLANLMRTLSTLGPRHPDLRAVVLGRDSRDEQLRLNASAVGVNGMVSFIDEPESYRAVLRASDAVWIAADGDEGAFGFLDAMALRLPVIAERGPLSRHFVADGLTGILLPGDERELLASAVALFLAMGDRRATMGNAGRARVQRDFTESTMIDGFERAGVAAGDRTKWAVR